LVDEKSESQRDIIEKLRKNLDQDENVLLAYLFGSVAKSTAWSGSDVDVAVLLKDNSWVNISKLMDEVADAAGVSVDKIDVIDLSKADEVFRCQVMSEGYKIIDRGFYEQGLYEIIYNKLFDEMDILNSYLNGGFNPFRREVLAMKLMALDEELNVLKTYVLSRRVDQVVGDPLIKRVLRDSLRVSIESIIDICKHIVTSMRLGIVRDYKDFPLKLAEANLMPMELAQGLSDYAKLRNITVHRYTELNYALLYEKATELVNSTAPAFRDQLAKLLKSVG